eukprot:TRINITY_DN6377_c0_g1_i1.p1 TRINITY_DN6377_c0_g1~~TRINITY_DN6377_c0_g1_i1.p1  ORF type:complete len:161 (+),score=17.43 TRINITY_DN6377_c0_g1_i1:131-613(+)
MAEEQVGYHSETKCDKVFHWAEYVVRILCLLIGLALIVIGAYIFSLLHNYSFSISLQLGVEAFYFMVFGIVCVIAETRHPKTMIILKWMLFLNTYLGRCIYYVFVGIVIYPLSLPKAKDIGKIMGGILVAAGILNLLLLPGRCRNDGQNKGKKQIIEVTV